MSTPCQTCLPIDCTNPSDIQQFGNNGYTFWNPSYTFVVNCPEGYNCANGTWPRIITIGQNEFEVNVPGNPNGFPFSIVCCQSTLTTNIPAGATESQIETLIQALLQQCAQQQAECNAIIQAPRPNPRRVRYRYYTNNVLVTAGCTGGKVDINQTNQVISSRVSVVNGQVRVSAGTWSYTVPSTMAAPDKYIYSPLAVLEGANQSVAVAQAISMATGYANSLFANLVSAGTIVCGYLNAPQAYTAECVPPETGPDVTVTKAAGTYSSLVSQAAADAAALAAATAEAEASLVCGEGCTNPDVPVPASLVSATGVVLETLELFDDQVTINFTDYPGGQYHIRFANVSAFGVDQSGGGFPNKYYTKDEANAGAPDVAFVRATTTNNTTGDVFNYMLDGVDPDTDPGAEARVITDTLALNPLREFYIDDESSLEMIAVAPILGNRRYFWFTSLGYPAIGSAQYELYQVKKVDYPQPWHIRIADWATIKEELSDCPTCIAAVSAEWNGEFATREFLETTVPLEDPQWTYETNPPYNEPAKSINACEMDSAWCWFDPGVGWELGIYFKLSPGPGFDVLWSGTKDKGTSPVGKYARASGCSVGPDCIVIEEF